MRGLVGAVQDSRVRTGVDTERAFLRFLEGGCSVPAGVHATVAVDGTIEVRGVIADPDGDGLIEAMRSGDDAEALGGALAEDLLAAGADRILAKVREAGE